MKKKEITIPNILRNVVTASADGHADTRLIQCRYVNGKFLETLKHTMIIITLDRRDTIIYYSSSCSGKFFMLTLLKIKLSTEYKSYSSSDW